MVYKRPVICRTSPILPRAVLSAMPYGNRAATDRTEITTSTAGSPSNSQQLRRLVLLGTPILIAAVEWFHVGTFSHIHTDLSPIRDEWLLIHLLQLPLFALLALCLHYLLAEFRGSIATIGRIGVGLFTVFYLSMDAIAGIATGVLLQVAHTLPPEQQAGVATAVQELFFHPIVGGEVSVFSVLGSIGYISAVVSAAVLYRHAGVRMLPVTMLGASSVFVAHPFPTGPLGMALFLSTMAWLEFGSK